jgi:hypothetical protein
MESPDLIDLLDLDRPDLTCETSMNISLFRLLVNRTRGIIGKNMTGRM